jgi:hypothetical protein
MIAVDAQDSHKAGSKLTDQLHSSDEGGFCSLRKSPEADREYGIDRF